MTINEERIRAALTPDHHSQAAYTGRIKQTETIVVHTEDGTPIQRDITCYISWDSIAQILAMIAKRAGINL